MSYRDCKLYVGNLSSGSTRSDLEKEFGYYGHLVNVWVARNPPGFAYVEFEDARDAKDAVRGLDGKTLFGRKLRVEIAHGMQRSRAGGGWGGGPPRRQFDPNDRCYNCGESGHYAYDCSLYSRSSRRRYVNF